MLDRSIINALPGLNLPDTTELTLIINKCTKPIPDPHPCRSKLSITVIPVIIVCSVKLFQRCTECQLCTVWPVQACRGRVCTRGLAKLYGVDTVPTVYGRLCSVLWYFFWCTELSVSVLSSVVDVRRRWLSVYQTVQFRARSADVRCRTAVLVNKYGVYNAVRSVQHVGTGRCTPSLGLRERQCPAGAGPWRS